MCFQIDEDGEEEPDHRLLCAIALACIVHQMIDCWSHTDKMPPKQYNDDDDDYDKLLAIKR